MSHDLRMLHLRVSLCVALFLAAGGMRAADVVTFTVQNTQQFPVEVYIYFENNNLEPPDLQIYDETQIIAAGATNVFHIPDTMITYPDNLLTMNVLATPYELVGNS